MAYNISIKNRKGEGVAYSGVNSITLDTPEGDELTIGINNEVEKSVDLDFSNGNMVVTPEGDDVFSKVEIKQPASLIPGNIAEGIDVAGIIGTLAAGGGGIVCVSGRVTGIGGPMTVTHNLGVVPFLVCIYSVNTITTNTNVDCAVAIDKNIVSNAQGLLRFKDGSNMANWVLTQQLADSDPAAGMGMTYAATATTFRVGASGSSRGLQSGKDYDWFALGLSET